MEVYRTRDYASSKSIEGILNAYMEREIECMVTTNDPFKRRFHYERIVAAKSTQIALEQGAIKELIGDA